MRKATTRRDFLKTSATLSATLGVPYFVPGRALGAEGSVPPSEKIVMASIGVGSMGSGHLRAFLGQKEVRVVAACDLRKTFRQKAKRRIDETYGNRDARTYHDFGPPRHRRGLHRDARPLAWPDRY